jgi:hypothetical protein
MSTSTAGSRSRSRSKAGTVGAVSGVVALLAAGWVGLISFTEVDVPEWTRVAGSWLLPLGVVGAVLAAGGTGRGRGWPWAVAGLVLAGAAVVVLVLMQVYVDH